ncbi:MAG: hypothetical protein ACRD4E_07615 [Bryobacteraceae bacterium]
MICPNEHGTDVECADCRGFVEVWERLDEFGAPEVSPGFDARLYVRIAAEGPRKPWWHRLLWPPIAPVVAIAVAAVIMFVHVPTSRHATPELNKTDVEQVAQAVDDLDLLTPIDK